MYSCQNFADQFPACPEKEENSWGSITVLDHSETDDKNTCTRKVHVRAGCEIGTQSEKNYAQCWTVLEGSAQLTLGWELKFIQFGDSIKIPRDIRYSLRADQDLKIIQVLTGTAHVEDNK